jgi:DNA-binding IclR family transcriptional regulator
MKFNTLAKAIEIFDLFLKNRDSLDVYEIANSLHMPKSTAYAYLAFLKDSHFLDIADKPGKYKLGLRFLDYASMIRNQLDLTSVALPHMRELSKLLRSTIILTVHRGEYSCIVGKVEHDVGLVYIRNIGDRLPLYSGASSKMHLAYMKDSEVDQYLSTTELKKLSKHTFTKRSKLLEDLKKIRRLGYAFSNQEIDVGVSSVAAPILNGEKEVVASICVVGPVNSINRKNLGPIAGAVINCARAVSREMEYGKGSSE